MTCSLACVRSWATGINRVAIWSFENMYSETECWEWFRFPKARMSEILRELKLHDSGCPDGKWRFYDSRGIAQYAFEPMQVLVVFLARMSSLNTWSRLVRFLGGGSTTACKAAFSIALEHIFVHFRGTMSDITRWSAEADVWAAAVHAAGVAYDMLCGVGSYVDVVVVHVMRTITTNMKYEAKRTLFQHEFRSLAHGGIQLPLGRKLSSRGQRCARRCTRRVLRRIHRRDFPSLRASCFRPAARLLWLLQEPRREIPERGGPERSHRRLFWTRSWATRRWVPFATLEIPGAYAPFLPRRWPPLLRVWRSGIRSLPVYHAWFQGSDDSPAGCILVVNERCAHRG